MKALIKIDKNGTKYWEDNTCPKCGGSGYIGFFAHVDDGVCFMCGGNGVRITTYKEYTPEYQAKLDAKRKAKEDKKIAELSAKAGEKNLEFFEQHGFNKLGKTYVVLGNTYEIKDRLKELGSKWSNLIGWHLPVDTDEYPTVEIDVEDVYYKNIYQQYNWQNWNSTDSETYSVKIKAANDSLNAGLSTSEYTGSVGDKVTLSLEHVNTFSFDTIYGTTHIHKFLDENDNVVTWKTGNCLEKSYCVLTIKGTIKEHSEYNGEKQTVLTRCKVLVL